MRYIKQYRQWRPEKRDYEREHEIMNVSVYVLTICMYNQVGLGDLIARRDRSEIHAWRNE
jgi:hypothetical protein